MLLSVHTLCRRCFAYKNHVEIESCYIKQSWLSVEFFVVPTLKGLLFIRVEYNYKCPSEEKKKSLITFEFFCPLKRLYLTGSVSYLMFQFPKGNQPPERTVSIGLHDFTLCLAFVNRQVI